MRDIFDFALWLIIVTVEALVIMLLFDFGLLIVGAISLEEAINIARDLGRTIIFDWGPSCGVILVLFLIACGVSALCSALASWVSPFRRQQRRIETRARKARRQMDAASHMYLSEVSKLLRK